MRFGMPTAKLITMKIRPLKILAVALVALLLACAEGTGPSASENMISGAVNLAELSGVTSTDIMVYLVEFHPSGSFRVDSISPNYTGEYEFIGFDFGTFGIEASTRSGTYPFYYGFRDGNRDGVFNIQDAVVFADYGHIYNFNVPLYGEFPDTVRYETEPNDDPFSAQNFGIIHYVRIYGDVSSGGFFPPDQYIGDLDLFRFESVWRGYLTAELSWASGADLDMFLYDADGNNVLATAASGGHGYERLSRSVYRGEEMILLVASVDIPSSYVLTIRID